MLLAVPFAVRSLDESRVEFEPAAPLTESTRASAASPDATRSAAESPRPTARPMKSPDPTPSRPHDEGMTETLGVIDLSAPVLAYGPSDDDQFQLIHRDRQRVLWSDGVGAALPDGQGGVVLQPVGEAVLVWLPTGEETRPVRLVEAAGELLLRGVLPDGRVLYSVRPEDEDMSEASVEEFFAVTLAEGTEPELVGSTGALEHWTVGPAATADGQLVHAGCHLHCSLWPGLAAASEGLNPCTRAWRSRA